MTEIEQRIKELEQTSKSHKESIGKLSEEIKELKRELEKERAENERLLQSKRNSNNHLIYDNNRYAKTYEDKYIEIIDRLAEIEKRLK